MVAVVALAVGLAVGFVAGASRDAPTARGASPRAAEPIAREPLPDVRPTGDSALASALRELPVPAVERGNGTITGRVARTDGTPVPGVTVRATYQPRNHWRERADGPPPPPDIEEEVRRFVARLQRDRMTTVDTTTDRDGRYSLAGLVDGTYSVLGYLAGYRLTPLGHEAWQAKPGSTVDFQAEPVVEVSFDVLLPDGTPAQEATISFKTQRGTSSQAWGREEPRLLVAPGSYACDAEVSGEGRSDEASLDLREGAPAPPVLLRLKSRPGLRGTVSCARDLPFQHMSVYALAFVTEKPPGAEPLVSDGRSAWVQRGGRYQLPDLPRGRYLVGAGVDRIILVTRIVDIADRMETCDFAIETIDPSLYVVVRVFDPAGKPLRDVTFNTSYRVESGSSSGGSTVANRPDGSYLVFHHGHTMAEGGTYFVTAQSPVYGKKVASYKRGETAELLIRFGEPASLDVTVAGFAASEQAGALTVSLTRARSGENERFANPNESKALDSEGRVAFGPVEPGDYDVTLRIRASQHDTLPAGARRVTLAVGKNAVSLPMPRIQSLAVIDPDGKPGQSLALVPEAEGENNYWSRARARLDDERRALFSAVPEGRYQLRRDGGRFDGAMRVTIPGPAEITFRPAPFTAARVILSDADGAWAKAGFLDGDLIVAIDGDELESPEDLQLGMVLLRTKDKATVTILRAGGRVDLRVAPRELFSGEGRGGRVEWATR
jgi:hypothetical protein